MFGATKKKWVMRVFEGDDSENEIRFSLSNLVFSHSLSHCKSHHVVEQNTMGQIGQQMFINTAKIR